MRFSYSEWRGWTKATGPSLWRTAGLKTSRSAAVLVVDDDAIVAEMYRIALVRGGYDVLVARDGPAALQLAAASAPAIIFLDIRMPHMDGVEVLQRLAADAALSQIPVVMLSNYDDNNLIDRCLNLGAKEYLVKVNLNPNDLATVASRWITPIE